MEETDGGIVVIEVGKKMTVPEGIAMVVDANGCGDGCGQYLHVALYTCTFYHFFVSLSRVVSHITCLARDLNIPRQTSKRPCQP